MTVSLYDQDYTGVAAFATDAGGELFFAGVFDGAVPMTQYHSHSTIFVGKVVEETDKSIRLEEAIAISPQQMLNVHRATNYSPLDCLRGLWFELKTLQPETFGSLEVRTGTIKKRTELVVDGK